MTLAAPPIDFPRQTGRFEFPVEGTRAFAEAGHCFEANRGALEATWPQTLQCFSESLPELEWLYARDGSLSARHVDGQWVGQVSIPARAAARMLEKAVISCPSAVLLAPTHAQQVRFLLDRMLPHQVLFVVSPSESDAATILACTNFSAEIRAGRLWMAIGTQWDEELNAILRSKDGIAPPSMMIRVPGLNAAAVEQIQKPCDQLLSRNSVAHMDQLKQLHAAPRTPSRPVKKLCAINGPFKLWNDASHLLGQAAEQLTIDVAKLDTTAPTKSSALNVARTAFDCDAILAANVARVDMPLVVPNNVPWITWATHGRVPRADTSALADRLIVAEPGMRESALEAGWRAEQVSVGQEPIRAIAIQKNAMPAIIADLQPIKMPRSVEDMSSQRLVWERIEHEVTQNPLCIGDSPIEYMYRIAEQIGLIRSALPVDLFRTEILNPQFARSLAIHLQKHGAPFAIYGRGWDAIPELASRVRGPISTATEFEAALASTSVLIDVWPAEPSHPARRSGRPVMRAIRRDIASLVLELKRPSLVTRKSDAAVLNLGPVLASL